jgi:hypothetical protein
VLSLASRAPDVAGAGTEVQHEDEGDARGLESDDRASIRDACCRAR